MNRALALLLTALAAGIVGFFTARRMGREDVRPADTIDSLTRVPSSEMPSPSGGAPGLPGSTGPRWGGPQLVRPGADIAWSPRTLLDSAAVDVDRDGVPERVELYAAVERDRRGRVMFDDGQRWGVLVRDGADVYPLFDGFIQLGRIDFWVVTPYDSTAPVILLMQRTPNGVLIQKYSFDASRGAYASTGAVDAVGDVVHRPIPD